MGPAELIAAIVLWCDMHNVLPWNERNCQRRLLSCMSLYQATSLRIDGSSLSKKDKEEGLLKCFANELD